ncbi:MAG: alginate export family protein, partial [Candidatus Omnitrophica bacterium]|nr:alginate export family protein [Candidatus Omnitrophota bacterium]
MSKRLIMILALALVAGLTCAAYAEVQNVKISGDITVMAVSRNNLDLVKTPTTDGGAGSAVSTAAYDDKEEDLLSITRVRLDADLTDNVSTTVRLLNERNWNGESAAGTSESNRNIGLATANAVDEQDLDLDLAFVTLKEFLYSPLTLTVGRQELRFGNGWIVGDPDTNGAALRSHLAEGDLSARKSFDAIRATLDYDP